MAAVAGLGNSSVYGATSDWTGNTGNNWGTAGNWNTLPANGADLVFGSTTAARTTSTNNSLTSVNSLTFDGTQAFTVQGNTITLGTGSVAGVTISNNSNQTQTISFGGTGITLSSSAALNRWAATDGALDVTSKVALNGTSLGLHGANTITLGGVISGSGSQSEVASIIIGENGGSGHVVINGNNSGLSAPGGSVPYSVALLSGTLTIGNANALGTGTLLIDHSNNNGGADTFGSSTGFTIANGITARNSFTLAPTGVLNVDGNLTLDTSTGTTTFNLNNNKPQNANQVDFAGVVQQANGTASINFDGGGRFSFSGTSANTYTGLTTVSGSSQLELHKTGGVLAIQGDLTVGSGSKVQLQASSQIKTTSTVTMNGEWDFNGNSQTIATLTDSGNGTGSVRFGTGGQLTVNGSASSSFSGVVQDDGAETGVLELVKAGSGSLVLTGDNTYTGDTAVQDGALEVGNDAALGTGSVAVTGGTLETNGVQHLINVGGIYSESSGTLALTLLAAVNNDSEKMAVSGSSPSTLGGNLTINGNNITVTPNLSYQLVTFTDGYTGYFNASVTNVNLAGYIAMFDYTPDLVSLTFLQRLGGLQGLTPNQHSVGAYIDSYAANTTFIGGNFQTLVNNLYPLSTNAQAVGAALDQLTPQSLQIWRHIAFDNAEFSTQLVNNHLANLRDGATGFDGSQMSYLAPGTDPQLSQMKSRLLAWTPPATPGLLSDSGSAVLGGVKMTDEKDLKLNTPTPAQDPWSTFVAGTVILADLSHDQDLAHQDYTTGTVMAGADYRLNANWTVGALIGYGHTDADLDHIGSSTTVDTYSPGVYASYIDPAGWYGNGLFSYGYNSYTENRNISIGSLSGSNHGAPQGSQYVANLTGGYEFKEGSWKIGPTGSIQYVNLGIDSFSESGPTALNVQAESVQSLRTQLGFEARYAAMLKTCCGTLALTPHFSAVWQHDYLDEAGGITSQFNQLGTGSFTVTATGTERDAAFIDLGVDATLAENVTFFLDYETQAGQDHYYAEAVQAGLKVGF